MPRGEVFEILDDYKRGDLDIGEAYDLIVKEIKGGFPEMRGTKSRIRKPKRKLSAWNKFVKANSNKKIYKYANGKLKLKKMGIAFRKTPAGRKK
jgi:hypothetical protein